MQTTTTIRQVKLHSKFRASRSQTWVGAAGHEVPWLNVSGEWLRELGFNIGDRVIIRASEGRLIIEPVREEGNSDTLTAISTTTLKIAS